MDPNPNPGGPKTYGSYRSGFATLQYCKVKKNEGDTRIKGEESHKQVKS
jgi:hypothetical protein